MNTYAYSVLQYVPDPVRGERLNIGVLVAAEAGDYFGSRLLSKSALGRVKRLGGTEDLSFLQDIKDELARDHITQGTLPGAAEGTWDAAALRSASSEWANTVQLTAPRAALHANAPQLLRELFNSLVSDPTPTQARARDRRTINNRISRHIRQALRERLPEISPDRYLKRGVSVDGALQAHQFDFELRNGRPLDLVRSISFEARNTKVLQTEIDATAWAIDDLHKSPASTPVTVVTIGGGKQLGSAEAVYTSLGANFVREAEIGSWLKTASDRLLLAVEADAATHAS